MQAGIKASAKVEYPNAPIAIELQSKMASNRISDGIRFIRTVKMLSAKTNTAAKINSFSGDVPNFKKIAPKPCCNMPMVPFSPPPKYATFLVKAPNKS